ncbi:uncharacterized protein KGF55_002082 [Candida pseudojiufengensis]|uniref:uncharacterized protein n=1 Tax=Candida pseudojiufengensis TaxID=497109 RepID=UPI0022248B3C|nr:uncharacterized protein KGF55_002082 [Candida pseudojiufengensis]KAI5964140.1 hypothetical protein KGF55_002082 [Candida pseudojiufengensis]
MLSISKPLTSYIIRGLQFLFAVILLAVSAAFEAKIGWNFSRVSYNIAIAVLTILYLGYILSVSIFFKNQTFPLLIIISEFIFWIFYLAAWASIADYMSYYSSCNYIYYSSINNNYVSNNNTACQLYRSILPFGLLNWILFSIDLVLITIYIIIPFIKNKIFNQTLQQKEFIWGSLFINGDITSGGLTGTTGGFIDEEQQHGKYETESEPSNSQGQVIDDTTTDGIATSSEPQAQYTNTTTQVNP